MAKNNDEVLLIKALRQSLYSAYYQRFIDLLINCIEISELPADIPNDYVIKAGISKGRIGVYNYKDENNSIWLPVNLTGNRNLYGVYDSYELIAENGRTFKGNSNDTCVIRFSPTAKSFESWLRIKINELVEFDIAIKNNLEATQSTCILTTGNKQNKLSLLNMYEQRKLGVPVIVANEGFENSINAINTGADYLVDKLLADKQKVLNEIYASMGIIAGNSDKKERVQSYDLPVDLAIDSIYVIIDTFNKDAEKYGLKARMRLNGAIEELYNADNQEMKGDLYNE